MFELQKRIGYLFFFTGVFVCIVNILFYLPRYGFPGILKEIDVSLLAALTIFALTTTFFNSSFVRLLQFIFLCFTAVVSIIDAYRSFYGIGLLVMAIFLGFKYKYFEKRTVFKMVLIGSSYIGIVISIEVMQNAPEQSLYKVFPSILFLSLMVAFFIVLYRSEIREYLQRQVQFSSDINRLRTERDRLHGRLKQDREKLAHLDNRIKLLEEGQKPLNFENFGISPAEEKIIRVLCLYRCENREIAHRLHISVPTVKTHLHHIMNKLGVDDRFAVIDMCRNNFHGKTLN